MITHWTCASGLCRSCESVCSATLTIVVSRIDMIIPRITTPQTTHTWRSMWSDAAGLNAASAVCVGLQKTFGTESVRYRSFSFKGSGASHELVRSAVRYQR